jgi:iron complex outermembrane receptor protein
MIRKSIAFCLWVLLVPLLLQGQTTWHGRITDAQTGDPLAGANIQILSTGAGTSTDGLGTFVLTQPEPRVQIKVTFLGYSPEITWLNSRSSGKVIEISLNPVAISTNAVVVTAGF